VMARAAERWGGDGEERAEVKALPSEVPVRVGGLAVAERKPAWLRAPVRLGEDYRELRKRMRSRGYLLQCDDDKADYPARMQRLKAGELQFAVATVDSYVLNGAAKGFPATIVAVIDESKGGDAIVAWKDSVATIDELKKKAAVQIAFTPGSPSEHLLKAMGVHFDVALLRQRKNWRVEASGSPDALAKLLARKADVAVVWEPDVTRALSNPAIVKLLGSEDVDKLIVDVLLVGRKFSQDNPEAVATLLREYFNVARLYREDPMLGLLFTFGLAMTIEQSLRLLWGTTGLPFSIPDALRGTLLAGDFIYSYYRLTVLAVSAAAVLGCWLLLNRTSFGMIVRAGTRDPEMVRALGISLDPALAAVFALGVGLAGLAGVMSGPLAGVQPAMGIEIQTAAFVIVVIGGLGSFWGVVLAAVVVGLTKGVVTAAGYPQYSEAAIYLLMLLVLLLRPRGLFGERILRFE